MSVTSADARGILLALAASLVFVVNDSMMKVAMAGLPPFQVLAMRGVVATLLVAVILAVTGQWRAWRKMRDPWLWGRAGFETIAILFFIVALSKAPIGDVTAINMLAPVLLVAGAALFLGERVGALRWLLIGMAFAGGLMVAQPGTGDVSPYVSLAFVSAAAGAVRDLCSKRADPTCPPFLASFITVAMVLVFAALAGLWEDWNVPGAGATLLIAGSGVLIATAHALIFAAFWAGRVAVVAPFLYSATLFALMAGIIVFGDRPNALALAGIALVIVSGIALMRLRERGPGVAVGADNPISSA